MTKRERQRRMHSGVVLMLYAVLFAGAGVARGGPVPSIFVRSFDFPLWSATGVAGDLVVPAGTMSKLTFESGKVAVGDMPVSLPERAGPRRRGRAAQRFAAPAGKGPRARLLLSGVADGDGNLVTNGGNQLVVDALVSPGGAAPMGQPFTFSFDLNSGFGFLDVALPVEAQPDGSVRVQIIGISVLDPDGQPFATLGLELPPLRGTPAPSLTPPAIPTAVPEGWCFRGSNCTGRWGLSSQEDCCRSNLEPGPDASVATSWCPPDQFDSATGQCATNACQACAPPLADCGDRPACAGPCAIQCADRSAQAGTCASDGSCRCSAACGSTPTPTPEPCANLASCGGSCTLTCTDGTTVAGQCTPDPNGTCQCSAVCLAPTPCGIGECFDTITGSCTGQPCDPGLHCPLPNQLCDVSGRRCPCQPPPPLPHGHICCQCKDHVPACIDFSYVEVQPICPPGCDTFLGQECDATGAACVPLAPCTTDQDCDDGNGCTIDRCTASGCTHDCVCVGPAACVPGLGRGVP